MNKMQELIGEVNFRNLVFRFDDDDVSDRLFSSFFRLFSSTGLFIPFLLGILLQCFDSTLLCDCFIAREQEKTMAFAHFIFGSVCLQDNPASC